MDRDQQESSWYNLWQQIYFWVYRGKQMVQPQFDVVLHVDPHRSQVFISVGNDIFKVVHTTNANGIAVQQH